MKESSTDALFSLIEDRINDLITRRLNSFCGSQVALYSGLKNEVAITPSGKRMFMDHTIPSYKIPDGICYGSPKSFD
jgi:hypothetical protein